MMFNTEINKKETRSCIITSIFGSLFPMNWNSLRQIMINWYTEYTLLDKHSSAESRYWRVLPVYIQQLHSAAKCILRLTCSWYHVWIFYGQPRFANLEPVQHSLITINALPDRSNQVFSPHYFAYLTLLPFHYRPPSSFLYPSLITNPLSRFQGLKVGKRKQRWNITAHLYCFAVIT